MRFIYARLKGYVGIYSGLGLSEIEIDFSKAKNRIVTISGPNGCGKSTLLNALSVLPDSNDCFVPSMSASKELKVFDNGTIYDITITHPINSNGVRATSKASILKNGVELNPNGNISSYKDIIFNEFDLDNNYITLSHLSGNDRGLADKRPGERKKFVANITSSLEVYNDIHKNLSKKANVYKSYINNLSSKIVNLGDEQYLRSTKLSLESRYSRLLSDIESIKGQIVEAKTIVSLGDPDGSKQQRYTEIERQVKEQKLEMDKAFAFFNDMAKLYSELANTDNTKLELENLISTNEALYNNHFNKLEEYKLENISTLKSIENIRDNIDKLSIKVNKLIGEIDFELENKIKSLEDQMKTLEDHFSILGLGDIESTSNDEIKQLIKIIQDFINTIDIIYSNLNEYSLGRLYEFTKGDNTISKFKEDYTNNLLEERKIEVELSKELSELVLDLSIANESEKRPSKCNITTCPFLDNSNKVISKYGSINTLRDKIESIREEIEKHKEKIIVFENLLSELGSYSSTCTYLDAILSTISSNKALLEKASTTLGLINLEGLKTRISKGDRFNEYRDIHSFLQAANDIIEYKSINKIYNSLQSEYKINKNNIDTYSEAKTELDEENNKLSTLTESYNSSKRQMDFEENLVNSIKVKISNYKELLSRYNDWIDKQNKYNNSKSVFDDITKQFEQSANALSKLSGLESRLSSLQSEIAPIEQDRKTIDTQLSLLDTYKIEYNQYSEKYTVIDKLKTYSSPVNGGIQTLFMSLYMGKTLSLANQLLGMIFDGQYRLLDYVINQDEFRIPFVGSGLVVDDISSGSTSQVCIMGMIINLVLLHQGSTRYNITRLDEIDGGLDSHNRYLFVDILQRIVQILNIDQLFIISHSVESALQNVDMIQLAPIIGTDESYNGSNIIYTYKNKS